MKRMGKTDIRLRVDGQQGLSIDGDRLAISTEVGGLSLPLIPVRTPIAELSNIRQGLPEVIGNELVILSTESMLQQQTPVIPTPPAIVTSTEILPSTQLVDPGEAFVERSWRQHVKVLAAPPSSPLRGIEDVVYSARVDGNDSVAVASDSEGAAYLTGRAYSDFHPTPGAYLVVSNGASEVIVTKMSSDGSSRVYATF
jgi:hypothetical protein